MCVCYFVDFEMNDKSLLLKNDSERNSVYINDCYAIKIKDIQIFIKSYINKKKTRKKCKNLISGCQESSPTLAVAQSLRKPYPLIVVMKIYVVKG